jgi:hypothetical protein
VNQEWQANIASTLQKTHNLLKTQEVVTILADRIGEEKEQQSEEKDMVKSSKYDPPGRRDRLY